MPSLVETNRQPLLYGIGKLKGATGDKDRDQDFSDNLHLIR